MKKEEACGLLLAQSDPGADARGGYLAPFAFLVEVLGFLPPPLLPGPLSPMSLFPFAKLE
jgi:hypothetical protein